MNQKFKSWEMLMVNDHSTDESERVIHEHMAEDSRIQLLQNKGKGIINALQTAYSGSHGNFITRMDADDIMHPEKLQVMHDQLITFGRGHVATSLVNYFSEEGIQEGFKKYESWLNGLTLRGNNFNDIYKECVIPSPSWMMYKEDLNAIIAFDDLVYPEDYHLVFKMYKANMKVIPSNKVLHYWRDHPKRASRNDPNYQDNSFLPLKVKYFSELDHDPNKTLILWGAGKKGKKLAQLLLKQNIQFQWVCNNSNKWGKHIYGVQVKGAKELQNKPSQVIISVSDNNEHSTIIRELNSLIDSISVYQFF